MPSPTSSWWITGYLAQDGFSALRPASLTFSGPVARASEYLLAVLGIVLGMGLGIAWLERTEGS